MSQSHRDRLGRRDLLGLAAIGALAGLASACGMAGSSGGGGTGGAGAGGGGGSQASSTPSAAFQAVEATQPGRLRVLSVLLGPTPEDRFKTPSGVAVDADDNLYVADTGGKRICKFGPDGAFRLSWGGPDGGEVALDTPVDLSAAPDGSLWVLDKATGNLVNYDRDGKLLSTFAGRGFYGPSGVLAVEGAVYVADTGTGRVIRFSPGGELQAELTRRDGDGVTAKEPTGLTVDPDGSLVVIDGGLSRLMRLSPDGKLLAAFDAVAQGSARVVRLADGSYLVSDANRGRLLRWDRDGNLVARYGQNGTEEGSFRGPSGLALSREGHVYVADTHAHRIQKIVLE